MATTITRQDLVALPTYRQGRDEYLQKMIQYKKSRRMKLGTDISILFENRQTVLFQIQELTHNEDLSDPKELDEYIDIYSGMLPGDDELSATLFIEIDNQERLSQRLTELKGIEHHLFLQVGDEKLQAVFEEEHDDRDFTTAVHYLKFPLTSTAKAYLTNGSYEHENVRVILDHPNLSLEAPLGADHIASLAKDLA
ncbi:DUF3501 family protein [Tumebacillus permanentifrigoris]|uniref:Uncharacterized protein DUF3501 n=1 Tax=Tumebacillus permanentifrigoris TaxID=378543 RepID=A0A316D9X4_9BACL|nr:DUF3501 family protein [Tumebacillus permanentifrigoris]PWK13024.1 uncharacterized protein DUF3501 [Tumebacillus permanentifrigoris]